jgi:hypothetical protein
MRGCRVLLVLLPFVAASVAQQPSWQNASDSGALLETIKYEFSAARSASDPAQKANHYFLLNDASERFAIKLNESIGGVTDQSAALQRSKPRLEEANRNGAKIVWCESDARWAVTPDGYLEYLKLDPTGTYAEEAWWRGKLLHDLIPCIDSEGSLDESKHWLAAYQEFLRRFPKGEHLREARQELKYWQRELRSYKAPQ